MTKEERDKAQIYVACRRFLSKLGTRSTHPLVFKYMKEVAEKEFNLKIDGVDPTDCCFLPGPNPQLFFAKKKERKIKRKYEVQPDV